MTLFQKMKGISKIKGITNDFITIHTQGYWFIDLLQKGRERKIIFKKQNAQCVKSCPRKH